jgi:hypothetical protein
MSYASSAAIQEAVFAALTADAGVMALAGGAVFDAVPAGAVPGLYVTLGPERARERSDVTGEGATHDFSVRVVSDGAGFALAKALAVAISDALDQAPLSLSRGRLVSLHFRRAEAKRTGAARQIELWFRARVDLGPE